MRRTATASPRAPFPVVYHFTNSLTVIPDTPFRRAPTPGARYRPFEPAEDPYRTAARAPDTIHYQSMGKFGGTARAYDIEISAPSVFRPISEIDYAYSDRFLSGKHNHNAQARFLEKFGTRLED